MKKKLSIAIPTRNRFNTLKANLEYLIYQIQINHLSKYIDIIISDNSKTQETEILNICKSFDFIKYYYNIDNGHDVNIGYLINHCTSEYIWFCQDHTKISENFLVEIINTLKKNSYDYIFLSTKKNYFHEKFIENDKRYIVFKNVYLNTNLVSMNNIKKYYFEILKNFDGSLLVFQHSIIRSIFNTKNPKILIFYKQCSIYKFFNKKDEHFKTTWSNDLLNYINILNLSKEMLFDVINKENINLKYLSLIYRKNVHSSASVYSIYQLKKKSSHKTPIEKLDFLNHPTFTNFDRFIIKRLILNSNKYLFIALSSLKFFEFYLLIFSPSTFLKKIISKFN